MRRKPTIISYQSPFDHETMTSELTDIVVDSGSNDRMILDRIESPASGSSIETQQPLPQSEVVMRGSEAGIPQSERDLESAEDMSSRLTKPLVVYIDGPFGAPTSQIFRAQHAVLIGTGIGVTPFASILQSIMHRYWQARNTCPKCQYKWTNDLRASVGLNLRKVI